MKPVVVRVTLEVTVLAPDAPAGGQAVARAVQRGLAAMPSRFITYPSLQMLAFDKPDEE